MSDQFSTAAHESINPTMIMQTITVQDMLVDNAPSAAPVALTVSVSEAAEILGLSEPTIYRLISRRLLRILPGLRHKRITRRSLDVYCAGIVAD